MTIYSFLCLGAQTVFNGFSFIPFHRLPFIYVEMVVVGVDDCILFQAFIRYSMLLEIEDEVPIAYGRIPTLASFDGTNSNLVDLD